MYVYVYIYIFLSLVIGDLCDIDDCWSQRYGGADQRILVELKHHVAQSSMEY